jgi:CHASE2 domain-containing sensor protein
VTVEDVLAGKVTEAQVRGKLVLVGSVEDEREVEQGHWNPSRTRLGETGVFILARTVDQILRYGFIEQHVVEPAAAVVQLVAMAICGTVGFLLGARRGPLLRRALILSGGIVAVLVGLFTSHCLGTWILAIPTIWFFLVGYLTPMWFAYVDSASRSSGAERAPG